MAGHLHMANDWRALNGGRAFPNTQFFHHHSHFSPHMLAAIDRMDRPVNMLSPRVNSGWYFFYFHEIYINTVGKFLADIFVNFLRYSNK